MTVWSWLAAGFGGAALIVSVIIAAHDYRAQFEIENIWHQDAAILFLMGFIPLFVLFVAPFLVLHVVAVEGRREDGWRADCEQIAVVLDADWKIRTEPLLDREVCMYRVDGRWVDRESLGLAWWAQRLPEGVWPELSDAHSDPAGW